MDSVDENDLMIHVRLISCALSIQDQALIHEFDRLFSTLISSEYFVRVLTLAVQQVAEIDPHAYYWFLQHCDELPPHSSFDGCPIHSAERGG